VLRDRTAGDPMRQEVRWTDLTYEQIAGHLAEAGTPVSVPVVKQLLRKHGYVTRKAQKSKAMGGHPDRNQQFENIARLKREYLGSVNPIVSMDTKKKELIGNFYRAWHLLTQGVIETFDHDFPSFASGVVIPHGLYDARHNDGHVNLGTSHDTGEFACDSIERWWEEKGRVLYPRASSILLLCDGGGSNGYRVRAFKIELQRFANLTGWTVQVAHYPPYKSKYNPIEHRMFPHVDRSYRGVILQSVETVRNLIASTLTAGGLEVSASILRGAYQTGLKFAAEALENIRYFANKILPAWNYRIEPQTT
jgi:hypothetical protein